MADKEYINNGFKQKGNVCVMSSYATVIEYYSDKKILIEKHLDLYIKEYNIEYKRHNRSFLKKKHNAIFTHFHDYCRLRGMQGFNFVKEIHNNDCLDTKKYCKIINSKADGNLINAKDIFIIKKELIDNDSLAMVLYKVKNKKKLMHAVVVGYDEDSSSFFIKDPEKTKYKIENIFQSQDIYEYIIFNDYEL